MKAIDSSVVYVLAKLGISSIEDPELISIINAEVEYCV
jgi:hypothetical protein